MSSFPGHGHIRRGTRVYNRNNNNNDSTIIVVVRDRGRGRTKDARRVANWHVNSKVCPPRVINLRARRRGASIITVGQWNILCAGTYCYTGVDDGANFHIAEPTLGVRVGGKRLNYNNNDSTTVRNRKQINEYDSYDIYV